jgi:hypothetical protein
MTRFARDFVVACVLIALAVLFFLAINRIEMLVR